MFVDDCLLLMSLFNWLNCHNFGVVTTLLAGKSLINIVLDFAGRNKLVLKVCESSFKIISVFNNGVSNVAPKQQTARTVLPSIRNNRKFPAYLIDC